MNEDIKNIGTTFRLTKNQDRDLENIAKSFGIGKSTLATNIIIKYLNDDWETLLINHISYPRPVTKKIFSLLDKSQIAQVINYMTEYNYSLIESSKNEYSNEKIINTFKEWMKHSGCEVSIRSFNLKNIIEVHHEMERNWSEVTCVSIAKILDQLDNNIIRTFIDDNWFKIEFSAR